MTQRIDLALANKPLREFIHDLGKFNEAIELVVQGRIVAKLIPPAELSELEKQHIVDEGWAVVKKARANAAGISASVIRKEVNHAIQEVRTRHDHRCR